MCGIIQRIKMRFAEQVSSLWRDVWLLFCDVVGDFLHFESLSDRHFFDRKFFFEKFFSAASKRCFWGIYMRRLYNKDANLCHSIRNLPKTIDLVAQKCYNKLPNRLFLPTFAIVIPIFTLHSRKTCIIWAKKQGFINDNLRKNEERKRWSA